MQLIRCDRCTQEIPPSEDRVDMLVRPIDGGPRATPDVTNYHGACWPLMGNVQPATGSVVTLVGVPGVTA